MPIASPSNVIFVGPRRHYHAEHSGYETLARLVKGAVYAPTMSPTLERRTEAAAALVSERWRAQVLRRLGQRWYGRRRIIEELSLVPTLAFARRAVVHHLYAEESFRLGGYVPRLRGTALVGTFHQPASEFHRYVANPAHLRRLDALVAVARDQAEFLRSLVEPERVYFVPHGVDTDFFVPAANEATDFHCLFVGYWLRDVDTLGAAVRCLSAEGVTFDLITSRRLLELRGLPGVNVTTGLEEQAFRDAYQRASVFILPLRDATANNAMLEAMACGLPIVATDVGGIRDYCDAGNALLVPRGDVDAFVDAVRRLRAEPELRHRMGRRSRERAERDFQWPIVARAMQGVYEQALGNCR